MSRSYRHIQEYGKEILALKKQGKINRENIKIACFAFSHNHFSFFRCFFNFFPLLSLFLFLTFPTLFLNISFFLMYYVLYLTVNIYLYL